MVDFIFFILGGDVVFSGIVVQIEYEPLYA